MRAARRHPGRVPHRRTQRAAHRVLRRRDRFHPQLRRDDPALHLPQGVRAHLSGQGVSAHAGRGPACGAVLALRAEEAQRKSGTGQPPEEAGDGVRPHPLRGVFEGLTDGGEGGGRGCGTRDHRIQPRPELLAGHRRAGDGPQLRRRGIHPAGAAQRGQYDP